MTAITSPERDTGRHLPFLATAAGCGAFVCLYVLWSATTLGGDRVTVAFEDISEALIAAGAAAACLFASARSTGRMRMAWTLLGASALAWAAGEAGWAVYEVGLSVSVPFPSLADAGYVAAIPLAVAGILSFPSSPSSVLNRARALLDGGIVAAALIFVAWAFGLNTLYGNAQVPQGGRLLALAYPAADIVVMVLLGMALRRAAGQLRFAIVFVLLGFTANLAADSSFAYHTLVGDYGVLGSTLDAGWVAGYMLIGLAALWPVRAVAEAHDEGTVEIWQLAIPWIAISIVIASTVWFTLAGRPQGPQVAWIGSIIGLLFVFSQMLGFNDSLQLLARSRRAESELRDRTALLTEVIGRAPLGIARIAQDLRIIDANPSLGSMLGLPVRLLIGANLKDFLSEEDQAQASTRLGRLRRGELDNIDVDSEMVRADGRKVWVHRSISVVRKPDGDIDYHLVMFEDITTKHEVEQAALGNLASLERLNRLKSEFMSMVSHEFRTALTGIQGYSEVMNTGDVSPDEVKEFSGDINAESLRLNRMITEMLDLDRIESGRVTLQIAPVDLNTLIRGAAERAQMSTTKHKVTVVADPNLPSVDGDADRLTQVISNLLSNAIKYSPHGGDVVVTTRTVDGDVEVRVKDHGLGVAADFKSRIFGRYERYEGAGGSQVVGTGLGLAIAQQIIQLHKGRIWVESEPGDGSEFIFTIPAAGARLPSQNGLAGMPAA